MRQTCNTEENITHDTWLEIRDLSSGETEVGKEGFEGARIVAVLCTKATISSMPSSFSSAIYAISVVYTPFGSSWTYLHDFDTL
jgi:hypothetical protein